MWVDRSDPGIEAGRHQPRVLRTMTLSYTSYMISSSRDAQSKDLPEWCTEIMASTTAS